MDEELLCCQSVPVVAFLELHFGPHILDKAPDREAFQDAYINFTHWIQMKSNITQDKGGENDTSNVSSIISYRCATDRV